MPLGIGITELLIVGVLALLVFGPKRLPEMGRSLGRGMREFKDSVGGDRNRDDRDAGDEIAFAYEEEPFGYEEEPVRASSPLSRAGTAERA